MKPPTKAPATPRSIVIMHPPGSRPGISSFAIIPAISPKTIQLSTPNRLLLVAPAHLRLSLQVDCTSMRPARGRSTASSTGARCEGRLARAAVVDYGEKADGHVHQSLGTVGGFAAESQRVSRFEHVGQLSVPVLDLTFEHVQE